jgi:hypothetical protein
MFYDGSNWTHNVKNPKGERMRIVVLLAETKSIWA